MDVGANDGRDYTLPAALLGHRVYSFEPTPEKYHVIVQRLARLASSNVSHTTELDAFSSRPPGSVYLREGVAVSNHSGRATLTATRRSGQDAANSLHGLSALPRNARKNTRELPVALTTLSEVLAAERHGVFLLKIDAQGHELHVLQGARAYIASHPVYYILLEYYPKGLKAGHVNPLELLRTLQHELGYQCFDLRCSGAKAHQNAITFAQFVRKYPPTTANEFGTWTDLLCTRFDLL